MLSKPSADSQESLLLDRKHRCIIERIARKYTQGTSVIWEDALQTAFIKVLEAIKAGRFRHGGTEEFYRWATVVARYEIIDFVRREIRRQCSSLDQIVPGTDLSVLETIPDELNLFDAVERADLMLHVMNVIDSLHQRYPERGYLHIWQGQIQGKKQATIAQEMGITQPEVSKRRRELIIRVARELGLLPIQERQKVQKRTKTQW
ncbi:sigma-70 family RNA polymerase sigma factor [Calothrix sp. UHCC 0171]|uniref:sigma-70 family RNA polymerase sigma factor n=1 Tax=Calothrix sp. UHCC 0171 TaxID=3110245 RepID=UPI002B20DDFD|nr:sigma-70 family RNA polymerase sigma factor [Calothrix sp. UHCC 0171]MEA5571231.1 sigma-70 family RNA polymerase sigma factor [Calothrix sp. UHCC 0171]